jgi:hypothetical protein
VSRRRPVTLAAGGLVALGAALTAITGAALATTAGTNGAGGNEGTVKIHNGNTEDEPTGNNEPHVRRSFRNARPSATGGSFPAWTLRRAFGPPERVVRGGTKY